MSWGTVMAKKKRLIYQDLANDEFVKRPLHQKVITGDYCYIDERRFARLIAFFSYRLIATPIAFIYSRVFRRVKYVNRQVLKSFRKTGYFIYANHTHPQLDAFNPPLIVFPKRSYAIVDSSNVSLPILKDTTKLIGAIPLPSDFESGKNFINAIDTRIRQGHSIIIYPEAHVWPYYTDIRPLKSSAFKYPLRKNVPIFTFTTTYQRGLFNRLKIVVYVDGPFSSLQEKSKDERAEDLESIVYKTMKTRAKKSNYTKIIYEKRVEQ